MCSAIAHQKELCKALTYHLYIHKLQRTYYFHRERLSRRISARESPMAALPLKGPSQEDDLDEPSQPLRRSHGLTYIRRFLTTYAAARTRAHASPPCYIATPCATLSHQVACGLTAACRSTSPRALSRPQQELMEGQVPEALLRVRVLRAHYQPNDVRGDERVELRVGPARGRLHRPGHARLLDNGS